MKPTPGMWIYSYCVKEHLLLADLWPNWDVTCASWAVQIERFLTYSWIFPSRSKAWVLESLKRNHHKPVLNWNKVIRDV